MMFLKAFVIGGLICGIVQIFIDKTNLTPARIMVGLVVLGTILGGIGIYHPFLEFAGAGAGVPLLGFGNTLFQGVKKSVDSDGFLGIFMGGFQAGAVGITTALLAGYVCSMFFQSKMKG